MKFKPINPKEPWDSFSCPTGYYWVGHPDAKPKKGTSDYLLIQERHRLNFISGVSDPDASYSYDEYALVKLGRKYYLCNTSGCSCPSPSETWRVWSEGSKKDILKSIMEDDFIVDFDPWVVTWAKGGFK